MRLYVDSNVLICYIKQELGGLIKAQAIRTKEFFVKCRKEKHILIISDFALTEIQKAAYYSREEVEEFLKNFEILFEVIETTREIKEKSNSLLRTGIHRPDNLHVQLAIDSKAEAVVTWNLRDFKKTENIIRCYSPADLL